MRRLSGFVLATTLLAQPPAFNPPVPEAVVRAEASWAGKDALLPFLDSSPPSPYAIRAIGRLEDPMLVPKLLPLLNGAPAVREAAASAIAQSLKGFDPQRDPALVHTVAERLRDLASTSDLRVANAALEPMGRIAYANVADLNAAEQTLASIVTRTAIDTSIAKTRASALRGLEWLFRLNATLAHPQPQTMETIAAVVTGTHENDKGASRRNAFAALTAAKALDPGSTTAALSSDDAELRRMAMAGVAGVGVPLDEKVRTRLVLDGLGDESSSVRYEALRAYARHLTSTLGCDRIVQAVTDPASFARLAAVDALAESCAQDETITARIVTETRPPAATGSWTLPAHALVTLAKRSPDQARAALPAFAGHSIWQVRMYAARAAAILHDAPTLEKLAYDDSDNVREAALAAFRALKKDEAERAIVAALGRRDYQLVRSAALLLKDGGPNPQLARALLEALARMTAERRETSRDIRIALLDAIEVHGSADNASALAALLKDFDPVVATQAAELMTKWTGRTVTADPQVRHATNFGIAGHVCVSVNLKKGESFRITVDEVSAPITAQHFLQLAVIDHYYDGLTFHRVVPNFVIQGGSPGANEYWGQADFMRDEVGAPNALGSVGVSTRGRNTGDAQFFVNLVENTRLDYDYTVFANVFPADMPVVLGVEEGDEVAGVSAVSCGG
jgi:cyclophilin family peptidyl-prolyl cis-trans isomerase